VSSEQLDAAGEALQAYVTSEIEALRTANAALRQGNDALRQALRDAWYLLEDIDEEAEETHSAIAAQRRRWRVPLAGLLDED
jgi:hypothetical protein